MNKKELREFMKVERSKILPEQKKQMDFAVFQKIIASDFYKNSRVIFIYVSFGTEVDTHRIIQQCFEDNKVVCVPKVINKAEGMKTIEIKSISELKRSSYGILEPAGLENEIKPENIDLVIIPGLAFDNSGGRLGYGAGYYDRFLAQLKPEAFKIGIAYGIQLTAKVPMDENDVVIDKIITD